MMVEVQYTSLLPTSDALWVFIISARSKFPAIIATYRERKMGYFSAKHPWANKNPSYRFLTLNAIHNQMLCYPPKKLRQQFISNNVQSDVCNYKIILTDYIILSTNKLTKKKKNSCRQEHYYICTVLHIHYIPSDVSLIECLNTSVMRRSSNSHRLNVDISTTNWSKIKTYF